MAEAAAVIDLEKFRRERRRAAAPAHPPVAPATGSAPCVMPCWIAWVPVWLVR